jgi:hypothetical protein
MTSKQPNHRDELKQAPTEKREVKSERLHPTSPSLQTSPQDKSPFHDKKKVKTKVVIKYDCGFGNSLYIRGTGPGLSWEHGLQLKNHRPDEWVWETEAPFTRCEFKIILNDKQYEIGDNHMLIAGSAIQYSPKF